MRWPAWRPGRPSPAAGVARRRRARPGAWERRGSRPACPRFGHGSTGHRSAEAGLVRARRQLQEGLLPGAGAGRPAAVPRPSNRGVRGLGFPGDGRPRQGRRCVHGDRRRGRVTRPWCRRVSARSRWRCCAATCRTAGGSHGRRRCRICEGHCPSALAMAVKARPTHGRAAVGPPLRRRRAEDRSGSSTTGRIELLTNTPRDADAAGASRRHWSTWRWRVRVMIATRRGREALSPCDLLA